MRNSMSDDFFIEPDKSCDISALYDLCWRTWFDRFDNDLNIQNPLLETRKEIY